MNSIFQFSQACPFRPEKSRVGQEPDAVVLHISHVHDVRPALVHVTDLCFRIVVSATGGTVSSSCQCSLRETWGKPHMMTQSHSYCSGAAVVPGSPSSSSLSVLGRGQSLKPGGVYKSIPLSEAVGWCQRHRSQAVSSGKSLNPDQDFSNRTNF